MPFWDKSVFFRFFISIVLLIVLLTFLTLALIFRDVESFYRSQLINHLNGLAISLSDQLLPLLKDGSTDSIDRFAKLNGSRLGVRITVIDPSGRVLGDTEEDPQKMENHANRPEIRLALTQGTGSSFRFSTTVEHTLLYHALRIDDGSKPVGIVRVSLFADKIRPVLNKLKGRMAVTGILVILLAAVLAFLHAGSLYKPIRLIGRALEELSSGNFNTRLPSSITGEMGAIARHINETARGLEKLFKELKEEREELRSLVESLNVGLVVIDVEGRILMMNKGFMTTGLAQNGSCEGKYYWECFREGRVNEFIREFRQKPQSSFREIHLQGRVYLVTGTHIRSRRKILLTFQDISALKETERIKKDLVANISHEIKTPLTAIKGYVETLLEDERDKTKKRYLSVIYRHVNRLSDIAEGLITLHELDVEQPFQEVPVNLRDVVRRVVELYRRQAEEKGLSLRASVHSDVEIITDPLKLEELLINLVDNAIRYTREGEVKISVCETEDDAVTLSVSDTGIGIAAEHIPRIFERFYVVDRSRSRETGGTGLGLSIVKHIVERLGGTISVESTPGVGSTFIVKLPGRRKIVRGSCAPHDDRD
ncbi:ATP-binding protein [Thermodesulforhabdus norvegica]|uniref:histidine kinase n=1 Tax=Thermodesulforhabdus norvegica TaxID=39841 RepID=A0A1I4VW44_9BACT|nr:ATP-binding protein [Thermodesulforhabdus norvegica]SFN05443.1 two-component system, OmpR family, phosphate regulon sensor histidine kinase PhoR [Thermodesulforhabdus norvegica]